MRTHGPWRLLGPCPPAPLLEAASAAPQAAELLKESPLRLLCRVRSGSSTAVVKINRTQGVLDRLARLAALHPALREARALERALQAGLPVPKALAWRPGPGPEVRLLLADLGACTPLRAALALPGSGAPGLARAVGLLLARMHDAGLLHRDLHAGNLVVDCVGQLRLLDLQAARFLERPLSWPRRQGGLAFLWLSLRADCPAALAMRALAAYRTVAGLPPGSERSLGHWARRIDQEAGGLEECLLRRREDRPFRECSDFRRLEETGRLRILARTPAAAQLPRSLATLREASLECVRQGRRGGVLRGPGWYAKERDRRHARALWLAHERLRQRAIPAPEALALILEGSRGAVVARDLGSLPDLGQALAGADRRRIEAILGAAARLAARIHLGGLRNRDLKAANLLVREGPDGLELVPVDLDGVRRPWRLRPRHAARDLARLASSLAALGAAPEELLARYLSLPGIPDSWIDTIPARFRAALRRFGERV